MKNFSSRQILIIMMVSGLILSLYVYHETNQEFRKAVVEKENISKEFSELAGECDEISQQLENMIDSKEKLELRLNEIELELKNKTTETRPDIILNITESGEVRNIILMIGDGMGVGQITAAEIENGEDDLVISSLPYHSLVRTYSYSGYVTDSAASATALATGYKTMNGMISMTLDGGKPVTVVEAAESIGMSTGVITNTRVTHATPACFMAHVDSRGKEYDIADQILISGVDVVMGGGRTYFDSNDPSLAGYTVVTSTADLLEFESGKLLGLFSEGYMSYEAGRDPMLEPSLTEMTEKAIQLLSDDPDGFFLMVEGGRIDHSCHANDLDNTVIETLSFDSAVLEALEYASNRNDTLLIVTADHETGGLSIVGGYPNAEARYKWISDDHTGNMVPVYAYGPRAKDIIIFNDNTDIGKFILSLIK
jgi:alkaline phosphatase